MTIGYVSEELYGVWLTLSSILTMLGFLDIGLTQGLKNKLAEAIAREDWNEGKALVSTAYLLMAMIFIPVCLVLEAVVPFINWPSLLNVDSAFGGDITRTMVILVGFFCLQMIVNVFVSVVAAFQKVALSSSFNVIGQILSLLAIGILTKTVPSSLTVLCFAISAMPIIVTIIATLILFSGPFRAVSPSFSCADRKYFGSLFSLGYKFFIINVQVVVLYQSTNLLISNVSSPLQVTSYNLAYRYLSLAMMVYTAITAPLWPAYTDAFVKRDYEWMRQMRKRMHLVFALSAAACLMMIALSGPFYHFWLDGRAEIPFTMTCVVGLYIIVYCWMNLNGTLIVGMGKIQLETVIVVVGMLLHIPLSLFLSRYIGAYGVLASMIFINLMYGLIFHIQVGKLLSGKATGIWNK